MDEIMSKSRTTTLRSNGEPSARAHAVVEVRPGSGEAPPGSSKPPVPEERVVIVDPTRTATRVGGPAGSGPRNPEQRVWPPPRGPAIELPDHRPLTKAQRFWIDPELFAQWDREHAAGRAP
jgi:hypothetical protein